MAIQDSTLKTAHVQDNEIVKASDFEFAFEQVVENVSKATQMILESNQDFVINGKVLPYQGMNVQISPIYGVCKSTGKPFGRTETAVLEYGFAESSNGRVDIIEVKGDWETYDNQQRAFNDPDTDTQTYQYVDTKKLLKPVYQIKQGTEGSSVAPEVDLGWVKLAEVVIRANNSEIEAEDIKNITADIAGESNTDWTTQPTITYNIGYISDVNERFRVQHNENGTHKDNVIDTDSLNIGTGSKQINGNVLPIGGAVTIPSQEAISASDSILSVITKAVAVINSLYNNYLLYGTYGFKGSLSISSIADGNNVLTKPLTITVVGDGTASISINSSTVLSIDTNGKLSTNGYTATSNNHIVTKAVTDAISSSLSELTNRVTTAEQSLATKNKYANGVLSTGTDGRYSVDSVSIVVATTQNMTLSGDQGQIDGVTLTNGDYILVKSQTDAKTNGIYQYVNNAAWQRVNTYNTPNTLKGKIFSIQKGTNNGKKMFYLPNDTFTDPTSFGSDEINFLEYFGSILPLANRIAMRDSNGCAKTNQPQTSNDSVNKSYVDPIIITTNTKTISSTGDSLPTLAAGMTLKIMFTENITGSDTTTALTLTYKGSSIPVKISKDGTLQDVYAHNISSDTYRYIQAYTTIEVNYYDGKFIIVGNPVVLSSDDYTVYADGKVGNEEVGTVKAKATNEIPYGWLECNGQAISRTTYSKLFTKFNTQKYDGTNTLLSRYGTGDGSSTFNLPDYREVALVGIGSNGTDTIDTHDSYTLGEFKDDSFKSHEHSVDNALHVTYAYSSSNRVPTTGGGNYSLPPYAGSTSEVLVRWTGYTGGTTTHGKQKGVTYLIKAL